MYTLLLQPFIWIGRFIWRKTPLRFQAAVGRFFHIGKGFLAKITNIFRKKGNEEGAVKTWVPHKKQSKKIQRRMLFNKKNKNIKRRGVVKNCYSF